MFQDLPPCGFSANKERNGIELRFSRKPSADVLEALKTDGWRWSRFAACWYRKDSPAGRRSAARFLGPNGAALLLAGDTVGPVAPVESAPVPVATVAPVAEIAPPVAPVAEIAPPVAPVAPSRPAPVRGTVAPPARPARRPAAPRSTTISAPAGLISQLAGMFPVE